MQLNRFNDTQKTIINFKRSYEKAATIFRCTYPVVRRYKVPIADCDRFSFCAIANDTNIAVFVYDLEDDPRGSIVVFWDATRDIIYAHRKFHGRKVLSVKITDVWAAVTTPTCVYVYKLNSKHGEACVHCVTTYNNKHGAVSIRNASPYTYIMSSLSVSKGTIRINRGKKEINYIEAHQAPITCITLNNSGSLVATASTRGTIIRVFEVNSGDRLYEFRRGSTPTGICTIRFHPSSRWLAAASSHGSIHIFRVEYKENTMSQSMYSYLPVFMNTTSLFDVGRSRSCFNGKVSDGGCDVSFVYDPLKSVNARSHEDECILSVITFDDGLLFQSIFKPNGPSALKFISC